MRSGKGQDDTCHCMRTLVSLNGNLEHVIHRVMLRSSACVSGTEAGGATELPSEYNAALESV